MALATGLARQKPPANPGALLLQDFESRVAAYVKLRQRIESELPRLKPTDSGAEIARHQAELARKIRASRSHAREGQIFTPEISREFRRLIAIAMRGSDGLRVRTSLRRAAPVRFRLEVNETYPEARPLQSMPPTLLSNLPRLPPQLDYRLAGHDLILRDTGANIVVDLIRQAVP